ncbi:MAG: prepilin-type N-terminal cleavage/methylation domain-containing protein [Patescibacteria group bacterium]|nr:prepilin-type N-terminal cleavage/methylation domain-containing protein [Patescibacteria group bacterium]
MKGKKQGFSLIELLVYMGIFVATSVFLVGMFIVFTQINLRQKSVNEVNNQIDFVNNTVQRLVKDSSLIDMSIGSATSTIVLRMASSTMDPTQIYLEDGIIYLQEGSLTPIPLTDSNIVIDNFEAIKYGNNQSYATLQTFLSISYNTSNEKAAFKRSVQTAISRASAATFDSDVIPNTDNSFDIGNTNKKWNDAYFGGNVGIGVSPVAGAGLKTNSDIVISDPSKGVILKSPGGTCYRFTVLDGGNTTSTAVSCP